MQKQDTPSTVLIIAGNDPSGGAGICADIQAVTSLGCHPAPVITTLTVQDTGNALRVQTVDPDLVTAQITAVLNDMPVAAIKLGLLGSAAIGGAVASVLTDFPGVPIVLDPVFIAGGGARLAEGALIEVYLHNLIARAAIITPNAQEIRLLVPGAESAEEFVAGLLALGCKHVLLKGGDENTPEVNNILFHEGGRSTRFSWERLHGKFHGSGCTLASAIAACLATGMSMQEAVYQAQLFTWHALQDSYSPGKGQAVPNRLPQ